MARGDASIDAEWTIHCPACSRPVTVRQGDAAVACTHCHAAFAPQDLATAAHKKRPQPTEAPRDPSDELVGRTLGGWQLTRLIGRGGMGRVYEAQDGTGRRKVALKVLTEDLAADPAFVKRFRREARVLASLSHPHVVEILDRGEHDGRIWFAMEYVRGENLRRRLERALPAEEAVRIASEVASALAYAHARGVVHRDLKPENVLLDEEGRVHLVDFGLSRLAGDGGGGATTLLTRTDVILGTYEYMAPEQRRGDKDLDARADVFALGVILYEMLAGQLPLGRFAPPSQLRSDVPESLDAVVNQSLATERDARYPSAEAMQAALADAWSKRGKAVRPAQTPNATPGRRPADRALLAEAEAATLRGMLRHVDVLAGLDRVVGILLLLGAFGFVSLATFLGSFWLFPVGGIVLFIAGVIFLQLAGKLSRMREGSRDSQITASVLLLLFPPFLTAMGLYGLLVLTGDRARRAFAVGRKALEGPRPVVANRVVQIEKPPRKAAPWVVLRILFLVAVIWSLYAAFVAIETGKHLPNDTLAHAWDVMSEPRQFALKVSLAGALVSIGALVAAARRHRVRRGLGLAIASFVLFAACATVLSNAHLVHALASTSPRARQEVPWVFSQSPYPRLENRR